MGAGSGPGSPAQQAVQAALLRGAGVPFAAQPKLMAATENFPGPRPGLGDRAGLRRGRGGSRPCPPRPGTPGSPPIWPRCGPAG